MQGDQHPFVILKLLNSVTVLKLVDLTVDSSDTIHDFIRILVDLTENRNSCNAIHRGCLNFVDFCGDRIQAVSRSLELIDTEILIIGNPPQQ